MISINLIENDRPSWIVNYGSYYANIFSLLLNLNQDSLFTHLPPYASNWLYPILVAVRTICTPGAILSDPFIFPIAISI